jgi:hypothetical protein
MLWLKFVRGKESCMLAVGDKKTGTIRPDFDRSISIDFQGAKITTDTGFLLMREIDQRKLYGFAIEHGRDRSIRPVLAVSGHTLQHARSKGQLQTSRGKHWHYSPKDWRTLEPGLSERCMTRSFSKFLRRWQGKLL